MSFENVNAGREVENAKPFTESGKCFDEVRLVFDDQQTLFVSQNFLILASPVFEAMFKNDFKEKQTKTVHLKEKIYDDFLEFLMCIHPGLTGAANTVTTSNVLRIAPIAEEYQVARAISKCKLCMTGWVIKELEAAKKERLFIEYQVLPARNCFMVLKIVISLNYEDLIAHCVKVIAKFGHRIYYGSYEPDTISEDDLKEELQVDGQSVTARDVIRECRELFKSLPAHVRCEILSHRLALYSDNDMK